jgi:nitrite reductase/ring-hydroxylating ferredoxin subunit
VRARARAAPRAPSARARVAPPRYTHPCARAPASRARRAAPGSRQQVAAGGKSALLFWYRDEVYAVEARSPAEGAYSEGFLTARFTQDGCIECPTTKTTFDLKTGEIRAWYPDNPVLRALTPIDTCRPMEVFPVRVDGDTVAIDFEGSNLRAGATDGCARRARAAARRAAARWAGRPAPASPAKALLTRRVPRARAAP